MEETSGGLRLMLIFHSACPAGGGLIGEGRIGGGGEFTRPAGELRTSGCTRCLIQRLHPFRQVMEVLAVTIPLPLRVKRLVRATLGQGFTYPEPAPGRVGFALVFFQAASRCAVHLPGGAPVCDAPGRSAAVRSPCSASLRSHAPGRENCIPRRHWFTGSVAAGARSQDRCAPRSPT
jgi:hypothetical protein